ncbi:MAG TPA: DUF1697 domain-containing protein [Anaerolineales bacterium]|jgi:uncharacterized protein (DUF1697 family)
MPRLIAFLRAINVGGHTVKMELLRSCFQELGFENVETFIASGNVIFDAPGQDTSTLEKTIQRKLHSSLGYEVATFIRTGPELAALSLYRPFPLSQLETATAFNVAFLSSPPTEAGMTRLMALRNSIDDFHVHGREVYWLCHLKQSESTFSNAVLEKALGQPSTLRGMNTIKKLAEKYPPA